MANVDQKQYDAATAEIKRLIAVEQSHARLLVACKAALADPCRLDSLSDETEELLRAAIAAAPAEPRQ